MLEWMRKNKNNRDAAATLPRLWKSLIILTHEFHSQCVFLPRFLASRIKARRKCDRSGKTKTQVNHNRRREDGLLTQTHINRHIHLQNTTKSSKSKVNNIELAMALSGSLVNIYWIESVSRKIVCCCTIYACAFVISFIRFECGNAFWAAIISK